MSSSSVFQAIAVLLVALAMAGVVLFGANLPIYIDALTVCAGMLALVAWAHPRLPSPPVWIIAGLVGLAAMWAVVQGVPLPMQLMWLAHPLWQSASQQLPNLSSFISLAPLDVFETLQHFLAYGLVFAIAAAVGQKQSSARILLGGLAGAGILVCLYGLVIYLAGNNYVLWLPKNSYNESLTATFINRNTYATFAGVVVLLCLCMYLHRVGEVPSPSRANLNQRLRMLVGLTAPRVLWAIAALAVFITLVLSNSRAGLASTLVGVAVVWACLYAQVKGIRTALWGVAFTGVLLVLVLVGTIGPSVLQRMEVLEHDSAMRGKLFAFTYSMFSDVPWQGIGLGAFEENFRVVRDFSIPMVYTARIDHAHNSWLETLAEFGAPATALLVCALLVLMWKFVQGLEARRRGVIYPATAIGILVLVSMHALADFSPNIPGFCLFAIAALGVLLAQSQRHQENIPQTTMAQRVVVWVLALVAISAGSWSFMADVKAYPAERMVVSLKLGNEYSNEDINAARNQLTESLAIQPSSQRYNDLALLDMIQARNVAEDQGKDAPEVKALLSQAEVNLQETLQLSPANPYAWYRLAQVRQRLNNDPQGASQALMMSLYTGPAEPNLAWARLPMLLRYWSILGENEQSFASYAVSQAWLGHATRTWLRVSKLKGGSAWLAHTLYQAKVPDVETVWPRYTRTPWPYAGQ